MAPAFECLGHFRDNEVDGVDFLIWQRNSRLGDCASRFEGDVDRVDVELFGKTIADH